MGTGRSKHELTEADEIVAQIVTRLVRLADERNTSFARVVVSPADDEQDDHVYVRLQDATVVEVYVRPIKQGHRFLDTEIYNLETGLYVECHCSGLDAFMSAVEIENERSPGLAPA